MRHGVVITLLSAHAALLFDSSRRNFVTVDEVGHVAAGISHWQTGTYSMYRVNPPLARMLAVLPVLSVRPDTSSVVPVEAPGMRSEWRSGGRFSVDNADRYLGLVRLARLSAIVWSLIGGWLVYRWGRDLYGARAGFLGLALWCFGPNVLAHAPLVTPDMPSTVAALAASYVFWRYLRAPSWGLAVFAGLLLGIAQLTKFSALVLYGVWPFLWLIHRFGRRGLMQPSDGLARQARQIAAVFVLSIAILNVGYEFDGTGRQLGDLPFISRAFTGDPSKGTLMVVPAPAGNRFQNTWLGRLPMPLPAEYLRGIDAQRVDFERGLPSYLAGEWRTKGWWYYYLYALAVKVPIGAWALVLWGLALTLLVHSASARWVDELALWLPASVVMVLVSSQTGFNHHLRYVLLMSYWNAIKISARV